MSMEMDRSVDFKPVVYKNPMPIDQQFDMLLEEIEHMLDPWGRCEVCKAPATIHVYDHIKITSRTGMANLFREGTHKFCLEHKREPRVADRGYL